MDDSVKTADVVIVNSSNGDWQGVYLNGKLIDKCANKHCSFIVAE